jgi:sugar lactone lactonase YvrE
LSERDGLTLDGKGFYFTDSFAHEIYHFDYSVEDGILSNQRVFARFGDELGLPDGATIDSEGRLWTALWDGGAVVRLGLTGEIESQVTVPARKASSLTFGGSDYKDMYITTAGGNIRDSRMGSLPEPYSTKDATSQDVQSSSRKS